jgi:deoxyribodipyrimidine photo-lyase
MSVDPRVHLLNERPEPAQARHVLYWAQMNRRADSNHALEFAASIANDRKLPLLVYEGLTCTYPYASDRFHQFILEAVPETARRLRARGIGYVFNLRRRKRDANDALYRLAKDAVVVVTDDYPAFIAAGHNRRVPDRVEVPYYVVDSSCVVPMRLLEKKEYAAYTIRPKIHRMLDQHMRPVERVAVKVPYKEGPPDFHTEVRPENIKALVASCEIDHGVKPSVSFHGGALEAERRQRLFLDRSLSRYDAERNEPSAHATSNLSPWLHFGHVSSLRVALEARLHAAENDLDCGAFLEELIVRRELAFNHCRLAARADSLDELPDWARKTLDKHAGDQRDHRYTREQFEQAQTHDELWNATQTEMLLRGKIHGYYRMYWGKKVIEWSGSAQEALETMVYLHDRYALDGRDPNTYTNILWCFGLHDRPWKERPVFGMVRYMSLGGMKRKTGVPAYLEEIRRLELTGEDPYRLQ